MFTLVLNNGDDSPSKAGLRMCPENGEGTEAVVQILEDAPVLLLLSERSSPFQVDYSPYPSCQRLW